MLRERLGKKKMGLRRVPNVTNLKSNTMKNVLQRYGYLFASTMPMMCNLFFFTFLLTCVKVVFKKIFKNIGYINYNP